MIAAKTHQHIDLAAGISPSSHIKHRMAEVSTFNAKFAVVVTNIVGSMWCAYAFILLTLVSLPAVLSAFSIFSGVFPSWWSSHWLRMPAAKKRTTTPRS